MILAEDTLTYRIKIKDMPEDMRPRERLDRLGSESLTTPELLAILLRTGAKEMSALDLATYLLANCGSINGLKGLSIKDLCKIKGVGMAKATTIRAAMELGCRMSSEQSEKKDLITSPQHVYDLLKDRMRDYDREYFKAVYLNTKHHVIAVDVISIGSLNASLVHPRELFKNSIKRSAAAVILVHNHPSGDPTPSKEDIEITRRLAEAGNIIGIQILDHIVIGRDGFVSLKEQGVL